MSYNRKTSGTRDLALGESLSVNDGFWEVPGNVSSKPPRWIAHIDATGPAPQAGLAVDAKGEPLQGARTPGYINNGEGKCALAAFRLMPAVQTANSTFKFPPDWEWIVQFAFATALPQGTSGDTLSNFNASASTVDYKGRQNAKAPVRIARIFLVKTLAPAAPQPLPGGGFLSYDQATQALCAWLASGPAPTDVYDPAAPADMERLAAELTGIFVAGAPAAPAAATVLPAPELIGLPDSVYKLINAALACGKRHFIFHGPPGTGKTTLAEYVAEQIAGDDLSAGESPYTLLTGSSSWSSQDLVGGYQPLGPGKMGFIPGAMLRDFHKPIIIDELNRCPIDKVIGPLFSVLSGQATTLPYRVAVDDPASQCYRILPRPNPAKLPHEFAPGPGWAMVCTLNQMDKSQLEQISFALSRRFTWIRIGVPTDPRAFVREALEKRDLLKGANDAALPNPVADLWTLVNKRRELGAAPVIDFIKLCAAIDDDLDFLATPNAAVQEIFVLVMASTFLPLIEGISRAEAAECSAAIAAAWGLSGPTKEDLDLRFMELAP